MNRITCTRALSFAGSLARHSISIAAIGAVAIALTLAQTTPALAQDYDLMIRQALARQNAVVNQARSQVQQMVAQRMQDPAVQAAWQRHVRQNGGRPAMDHPTFTYCYIYTKGFSAHGMAHMRGNESAIQAREAAAWQGLREAQAQRAQAQQAQRDGYSANQQEAGRQLMGQSTYRLPNGQPLQLPHTWQANASYQYQGQTYHVDTGGRYFALAANGTWIPLVAGR
jgi:hypothetical protein